MDKWGEHPALYAIEPVNEPWGNSDMDTLFSFYRRVRALIKKQQPRLKFVFHESFHFDPNLWNNLFADDDHENVVMDTHQYFAWYGQHGDIGTYCDDYGSLMNKAK